MHAAATGRCEFGCSAGQSGTTKILNADDQLGRIQLEASFDEYLLRERVANLHRRKLLPASTGLVTVERLRSQHRHTADAVETGTRSEQDDLVSHARGERQVHVLDTHDPGTKGVEERVARVRGVEHRFAADVGEAQGVSVATDARDYAAQNSACIGCVRGAETQLVHDGNGACAHRHDVADDAADACGGTLIRLDIGRVVVALDLERDRPAVADVHDAGVLADAREHGGAHLIRGGLTEVLQVHL